MDLTERLKQPGTLVADGASGTMLQQLGLPAGMPPEQWNIEKPEAIAKLHRAYVDADADLILTNTFGATRLRLEKAKLGDRFRDINLAAVRIAKDAAKQHSFVFGDIGPTGKMLEPLGNLSTKQAEDAFSEQVTVLAEGRVDAIWIETMSDLGEAITAVNAARKSTDLPIFVSMSFDTNGRTMMGVKPEEAALELRPLGVTAIGANCGRSLDDTLEAITKMAEVQPEAMLFAKPNAGLPHEEDGQSIYDVSPETMADYAEKFVGVGVKIFGGCCGSTPEHIRAISDRIHNKDNL